MPKVGDVWFDGEVRLDEDGISRRAAALGQNAGGEFQRGFKPNVDGAVDWDRLIRGSQNAGQQSSVAYTREMIDGQRKSITAMEQDHQAFMARQSQAFRNMEDQRVMASSDGNSRIERMRNDIIRQTEADRRLSDSYRAEGQRAADHYSREVNKGFDGIIRAYRGALGVQDDDHDVHVRRRFGREKNDVDVHYNTIGRLAASLFGKALESGGEAVSGAFKSLANLGMTTFEQVSQHGLRAAMTGIGTLMTNVMSSTGPIGQAIVGGAVLLAGALLATLVGLVGVWVAALAGVAITALGAAMALAAGLILAGGFLGIAAAAIAAGIMLLKDDPRVQGALQHLKENAVDKVLNTEGAQRFKETLVGVINQIAQKFNEWGPIIGRILDGAARILPIITNGITGFVDKLLPAIDRLVNSPFIQKLSGVFAEGLVKAGDAFAKFIDKFLANGPAMQGALEAMKSGFDLLGWAVNGLGDGLNKLSALWAQLKANKDVLDILRMLGDSLGIIGNKLVEMVQRVTSNHEAMNGFKVILNATIAVILWLLDVITVIVIKAGEFVSWFQRMWQSSETFRVAVIAIGIALAGPIILVGLLVVAIVALLAVFAIITAAIVMVGIILVQNFMAALTWVRTHWGQGWTWAKEHFLSIWNSIISFLTSTIGRFLAPIISIVEGIVKFFKWLFDILIGHSIIPDMINAIVAAFRGFVSAVVGVVSFLVGAVVSVFQGIATVAIAIWNFLFSSVMNIVRAAITVVTTIISTGMTIVTTVIQTGMSIVVAAWTTIWNIIVTTVQTIINIVTTVISTGIEIVKAVIQTGMNIVLSIWNAIWDTIVAFLRAIWETIKAVFSGNFESIKGIWQSFLDTLNKIWNDVWNAIVKFVTETWDRINDMIRFAVGVVIDTVKGWAENIRNLWENLWHTIFNFVTETWDKINDMIRNAVASVIETVRGWAENIRELWNNLWETVHNFVMEKWNQIKNVINEAIAVVKAVISTMAEEVKKAWSDFWEGVHQVAAGIWEKIVSAVAGGINKVIGILNSGIDAINGVLGKLGVDFKIEKIAEVAGSGPAPVGGSVKPQGNAGGVATGGIVGDNSKPWSYAGGGRLVGPGGGTDDMIPTQLRETGGAGPWVSNDEYVMNAKASQAIGYSNLDYMNTHGIFPNGIGRNFASGLAGGGAVGSATGDKSWALAGGAKIVWRGANGDNESLMEQHRNHVHIAMSVPPSQDSGSNPAIVAAMAGAGVPLSPVSGYRSGSTGSGGGLDNHSKGIATDFGGYEQDALAAFAGSAPGVIELIHRTNKGDYGIFGGGGSILNEFLAKGIDWVMGNMVNPVIDDLVGKLPGGQVMGEVGKGVAQKLKESLKKKIDNFIKQLLSAAASAAKAVGGKVGSVGGGVEKWRGIGAQALQMLGMPADWITGLLAKMTTESNGDPSAVNNSDINAQHGDPSRGLMQVIGSTFRAYAMPGYNSDVNDPLSNILAALRYIQARYGGVPGLPSGGYDNGGPLPHNTAAINTSGHTEMVLNSRQAAALEDRIRGGGDQGSATHPVHVTVMVDGVKRDAEVVVEEMLDELTRTLKRRV